MGYRTLVVFNNDCAEAWSKDPALGQKILGAANLLAIDPEAANTRLQGARVLECAHADVSTLLAVGDYGTTGTQALARVSWRKEESEDARMERLLHAAADALGYTLVKKS